MVPAIDDSLPGNEYATERRYIITGRDLAERVHGDPPFRQLQKATQVLVFSMSAPLDEGIPYTLKPFDMQNDTHFDMDDNTPRDVDNFTAQTTLPFNDFGPLYIKNAGNIRTRSESGVA